MLYLLVFVNVREYTTNDLPFWGEVFFTCLCIQYLIFHLPIKFDLKKKKKSTKTSNSKMYLKRYFDVLPVVYTYEVAIWGFPE